MVHPVAVERTEEPSFVTIGEGFLWWGQFDAPTIHRASLPGGEIEDAATGVQRIRGVRGLDGGHVQVDRRMA